VSLSTHVLDTAAGRPAARVDVRLSRHDGSAWIEVSRHSTNDDGRVAALVAGGTPLATGTYRLTFDVGPYFERLRVESFYGAIVIDFVVRDAGAHYHVPLLVSPYGYSTYRGS
jgi:5-hydroxyisourate hydrolase